MKLKVSLGVLFFWLSLGGIYLLSLYLDALRYQTGFKLSVPMVLTTMLVYLAWSGLTVVLYYFLKGPVRAGRLKQCIGVFVIGLILTMPMIAYLDHGINAVFEQRAWPSWNLLLSNLRYVYVFFNVVLYVVVFIVCAGFIYHQSLQEMKLEAIAMSKQQAEIEFKLIDMKMQALQSQLSPHFLFNCLNAISALTRMAEKSQVIKAIARLGDLLRYAVAASEKAFIDLHEELVFIDNYVALQKLRLGDQFEFTLHCESALRVYTCPPFILHTLVENAIVHGLGEDNQLLKVKVAINTADDQLIFSVFNSVSQNQASGLKDGLGVATDNLKKRLTLLYGSESFTISSQKELTGFTAVVKVPIDEAGQCVFSRQYETLQNE